MELYLLSMAAGLGMVLLVTPLLLRVAGRHPSWRRDSDLHHENQASVPRLGGVSLLAAYLAVEIVLAFTAEGASGWKPPRLTIPLSCLLMFAVGFWDDLQPLGALKKLFLQLAIATWVWSEGIGVKALSLPGFDGVVLATGFGALFTIAWLVGITNLINIVDGVDGLAGGISLALLVLIAAAGYSTGSSAWPCLGMAGALLGFLWFNLPPARIFLGDGGAYLLGFQIALFSLLNSRNETGMAALLAPSFLLVVPVLDAVVSLLRRAIQGLPVFRPDRRHFHHRLLQTGLSKWQVLWTAYGVTLLLFPLGLAAVWHQGRGVLVLWGIALGILVVCGRKFEFSREWFAVHRVICRCLRDRQQIRYALCLTKWVALEGTRCQNANGLWEDFVLAARKLGFSHVRLSLANGERCWAVAVPRPCDQSATYRLRGGRLGELHLRAARPEGLEMQRRNSAGRSTEERTFEVCAELLAEAWIEAIERWHGVSQEFQKSAASASNRNRRSFEEPEFERNPHAGPGSTGTVVVARARVATNV